MQVLGLERADTLALVGRLPGLLAISPHTLALRAGTLVQMLQGVLPAAMEQQPQQGQARRLDASQGAAVGGAVHDGMGRGRLSSAGAAREVMGSGGAV